MSKKTAWLRIAAIIAIAGFLWTRAVSTDDSIGAILSFAAAGTVFGLGLVWIGRRFASLSFNRRLAAVSAGIGFLILTPVIAMLLNESSDPSNSSSVVLAVSAAGTAALAGAVWHVLSLAGDAFSEWRNDGKKPTPQLRPREAHR